MAIPEKASQSVPRLFNLPVELKSHIFDLLPFATLQVLHATHPHFREIIDLEPSKYCQRHDTQQRPDGHVWKPPYNPAASEMLTAAISDPFLNRRNLKPCAYCLRLRSVEHFIKPYMKKPKRDYIAFCIDCGLKHKKYQPGQRCDIKTQPGVYCLQCRVIRRGDDALMIEGWARLCRKCGEIAEELWEEDEAFAEEMRREGEARRATAARKAARRERNARLKEIMVDSDYDDEKSVSTVEETPSEADFRMIQAEAEDFNHD
ncbi:hypothetical protein MMC27_007689 [Xylographa pallens]|nr:hypothetical protein [Xylographa pallens]